MTEFMLGVVLSVVPGLITGWIGWLVVGGLMHRNSYCRHTISEPMVSAPSISAVAERVGPERAAVSNGTDLPQLAILQVPQLAKPQVVVVPVFMQLTPPLQALPQWPSQRPITLEIPELESYSKQNELI